MEKDKFALEDDPLYALLEDIVIANGEPIIDFSASELYIKLEKHAEQLKMKDFSRRYKSPGSIGKRINNVQDELRRVFDVKIRKGSKNITLYSFYPLGGSAEEEFETEKLKKKSEKEEEKKTKEEEKRRRIAENWKKEQEEIRQKIRSGELAEEMRKGKKGYSKDEWVSITWYYLSDMIGGEKDWDELKDLLSQQLKKKEKVKSKKEEARAEKETKKKPPEDMAKVVKRIRAKHGKSGSEGEK